MSHMLPSFLIFRAVRNVLPAGTEGLNWDKKRSREQFVHAILGIGSVMNFRLGFGKVSSRLLRTCSRSCLWLEAIILRSQVFQENDFRFTVGLFRVVDVEFAKITGYNPAGPLGIGQFSGVAFGLLKGGAAASRRTAWLAFSDPCPSLLARSGRE